MGGVGGVRGWGGILHVKSQSAKINDNSGGGILQLKSQSGNISDNFHWGGVFCI